MFSKINPRNLDTSLINLDDIKYKEISEDSFIKRLLFLKKKKISKIPDGFLINKDEWKKFQSNNNKLSSSLKNSLKNLIKNSKNDKVLFNLHFETFFSHRSNIFIPFIGMNSNIFRQIKLNYSKEKALKCYISFIYNYSSFCFDIDESIFKETFQKLSNKFDDDLVLLEKTLDSFKKLIADKNVNISKNRYKQLILLVKKIFKYRSKNFDQFNEISKSDLDNKNVLITSFNLNFSDNLIFGKLITRNPNNKNKIDPYGNLFFNSSFFMPNWFKTNRVKFSDLKKKNKKLYRKVKNSSKKIESLFNDVMELEFLYFNSKLFIFNIKSAAISSNVKYNFLNDLYNSNKINEKQLIMRLKTSDLQDFTHKSLNITSDDKLISKGKTSSSISVSGKVVFNKYDVNLFYKRRPLILIKESLNYEDLDLLKKCEAIIIRSETTSEKVFSFAKKLGKSLLVEVEDLDYSSSSALLCSKQIKKGDWISIDGYNGRIYEGKIELIEPKLPKGFKNILTITNKYKDFSIKSKVSNHNEIKKSRLYLSDGVGLLEIEDLLNEKEINLIKQMIFSFDEKSRRDVLRKVLPSLRNNFFRFFSSLSGNSVSISLFSSSLNQYLPSMNNFGEIENLSHELNISENKIIQMIKNFKINKSDFGFRGSRIGVVYPEFYGMQIQALFEALIKIYDDGKIIYPEIMIPTISFPREVSFFKEKIEDIANNMMSDYNIKLNYSIGCLIENSIGCLKLEKIIEKTDIICFNLDCLSNNIFEMSEENSKFFFGEYLKNNIINEDFFEDIDSNILNFISNKIGKIKDIDQNVKVGLLGKKLNNKKSVEKILNLKLDYIVVNPDNIPETKLLVSKNHLINLSS